MMLAVMMIGNETDDVSSDEKEDEDKHELSLCVYIYTICMYCTI
jgi:hypothetical protein